jgi:archaemetzincin
LAVLALLPIGPVDEGALQAVEAAVRGSLGLEVRKMAAIPLPEYTLDARRGQVESTALMSSVRKLLPPEAERILAVTEADLFIPMLSYVFGQAQLGGQAALISLARLRQEFYELPPNPMLLAARAIKEALHELGHTCGLVHCEDAACTMSLSTSIRQVDAKSGGFCPSCRALMREGGPASDDAGGEEGP